MRKPGPKYLSSIPYRPLPPAVIEAIIKPNYDTNLGATFNYSKHN